MNMRNFFRTLAVIAAFATASQAGATVVLQVNNGILMGATGVDVGGTLYDVTFADGTCAKVFGTCSRSKFAFTTLTMAEAAGQSLLDQVFIDGPAGQFDSDSTKILGCTYTTSCTTYIPYLVLATSVSVEGSFNRSASSGGVDGVSNTYMGLADSTASLISVNFAVFKLAAPPAATVPEPSSIALMGLALAGLAFARRRRQA